MPIQTWRPDARWSLTSTWATPGWRPMIRPVAVSAKRWPASSPRVQVTMPRVSEPNAVGAIGWLGVGPGISGAPVDGVWIRPYIGSWGRGVAYPGGGVIGIAIGPPYDAGPPGPGRRRARAAIAAAAPIAISPPTTRPAASGALFAGR